ncbi:hypothetical protein [Blastopirellula marina]|uniref:Carboxypeptidase regulatory-like domain-containing protein n=1 Tax=Blastopirellula marina TaxID=124 RepID=A0A2S8GRA6_9BACT|nr:hypothetical protein [Blastopirellula marina]PQO46968.1 hypothetical protein C5Y93_05575 [Blastopirellula marina]
MKTVIPSWIVPALLLLGLTGCGSGNSGTVSGTLTVDGEPSGGYFVYFEPTDGNAEAVGGAVADGSYSLTYGRGSTQIPVGEYRVYVTPTDLIDNVPMPKVKVEADYLNRDKTTLVKKVEAGTNVIDLEIPSRKGK